MTSLREILADFGARTPQAPAVPAPSRPPLTLGDLGRSTAEPADTLASFRR